jgi:predicted Rdx family selenoprotein
MGEHKVAPLRIFHGNEPAQNGEPFLGLGFLVPFAPGLDHISLKVGGKAMFIKRFLHVDDNLIRGRKSRGFVPETDVIDGRVPTADRVDLGKIGTGVDAHVQVGPGKNGVSEKMGLQTFVVGGGRWFEG